MLNNSNSVRGAGLILAIGICLPVLVSGQQARLDITGASLEDLMNMEVTSVSKKDQSLSKVASAVFVITQEDIRHSGAANIPDLLRMVPGVEVARINANTWAISIRGFNFRYSSKVLVLVDGRTVYTPLFSGVFWDQQSMPLENIERIEVIRGPGGTVWGANAINGVINIITKKTDDTQGGLIAAEAGSLDRAQGLVQYGGTAGARGSYRVYGRYATTSNSPTLPGTPAVDAAHNSQAGFRSDWDLSARDSLTVQGDLSGASESQTLTTLFSNRLPNLYTFDDKIRVGAGNLLGRWNHLFDNGSETTLQIYYDRYRRFDQGFNVVSTGDLDFQYHFHAGARNDIVAGAGYRLARLLYKDGYDIAFGNGTQTDPLFSTFIQNEIALSKSVSLTLGIRLEHNVDTGFEYEPSVQLAWSPTRRHTLWGSVARVIEEPSDFHEEAKYDIATFPEPGGGFALLQLQGNSETTASRLLNYEAGYRAELSKRLTLDTTAYVSDYRSLYTLEQHTPFFTPSPQPPHLVLPNIFTNHGSARNYGGEVSARWDATKWWRLSPGFSFLQMQLSQDAGSNDTVFAATSGDSPKRQAQLRSNIRLPNRVEWDISAYYVGRLGNGPVPAYTRLDTRLGWHIGEFVEASIAGQNLLSPAHVEFRDNLEVGPTQAGRAVIGRITWHF